MEVKLIRMSSGEDIVAEFFSKTDEIVSIKNPIVAIPTGAGKLGFAPWSPIVSREIESLDINARFVIYISDPDPDVVDQYKNMFSTISTPPSKKLIV
jgi:hypothetical protein